MVGVQSRIFSNRRYCGQHADEALIENGCMCDTAALVRRSDGEAVHPLAKELEYMKTTTCLAVLLICVTFKSSAAQIPTPSDTRSTNVLAQQAALMAPGQWVVLNQAGDGS